MAGVTTDFDFEQLPKDIEKFFTAFMTEFTIRVQQRTPVRTGTLQASWQFNVDDDGNIEFGSDVDYAEFVEFGTDRMSPVLMVSTTCLEAQQIADKVIKSLKLK